MEEKKVVLVTGGASGIGFGTIEYLLEQGKYNVISFSRGENNIAIAKEKLKEWIRKYHIMLFSVGNGTASRESEQVIVELFH